ncbi:substrate-binding domain-containing protein (plasmid) [Rhizobium johnstonii]|nr:substrate-binding domain-containing protein [Rhizobium johnstonii]
MTFRNPPTGDLADMVRIIQQTTAEKPDGIIVTIPDVETVGGAIEDAVAKGIPVVTMNTGTAEEIQEARRPASCRTARIRRRQGEPVRRREGCGHHVVPLRQQSLPQRRRAAALRGLRGRHGCATRRPDDRLGHRRDRNRQPCKRRIFPIMRIRVTVLTLGR